jgi:hypothetical protein
MYRVSGKTVFIYGQNPGKSCGIFKTFEQCWVLGTLALCVKTGGLPQLNTNFFTPLSTVLAAKTNLLAASFSQFTHSSITTTTNLTKLNKKEYT